MPKPAANIGKTILGVFARGSTSKITAASLSGIRKNVYARTASLMKLVKNKSKYTDDEHCEHLYALAESLAYEFKRYTIDYIMNNYLGLPKKSPFTSMVQERKSKVPLINIGLLMNKFFIVAPTATGYKAGFAETSVYRSDYSMTVRDVLNILERGGKVPKNLASYNKVLAYIWIKMREHYGSRKLREMIKKGQIKFKPKGQKYYRIPPRRFFDQIYSSFVASRIIKGIDFSKRGRMLYIKVKC